MCPHMLSTILGKVKVGASGKPWSKWGDLLVLFWQVVEIVIFPRGRLKVQRMLVAC